MAASFSLTGSLRLDPRWTDDLNTTTVLDSARVNISFTLADGDGDGEANAFWKDVRTLAAGGTESIAMAAGLSLSVFGGSGDLQLNPQKVRLFYARNLSSSVTLQLVLEDDDTLPLPPGGVLLLSWPKDGALAGPNGGDFYVINPGASAADYEIILIGVQAP